MRFADAPFYTLPGHDEIVARRLQGEVASSADVAVVGHSTFPEGSVVPMDTGSIAKIYVVTEGTLSIEAADGTVHLLETGDSVSIAAGEARAIRNRGVGQATMIVITPVAAAPASAR